jgi:hypothetical protein
LLLAFPSALFLELEFDAIERAQLLIGGALVFDTLIASQYKYKLPSLV